jgi:hypothetical protein
MVFAAAAAYVCVDMPDDDLQLVRQQLDEPPAGR